jgi:hypothetical protein
MQTAMIVFNHLMNITMHSQEYIDDLEDHSVRK